MHKLLQVFAVSRTLKINKNTLSTSCIGVPTGLRCVPGNSGIRFYVWIYRFFCTTCYLSTISHRDTVPRMWDNHKVEKKTTLLPVSVGNCPNHSLTMKLSNNNNCDLTTLPVSRQDICRHSVSWSAAQTDVGNCDTQSSAKIRVNRHINRHHYNKVLTASYLPLTWLSRYGATSIDFWIGLWLLDVSRQANVQKQCRKSRRPSFLIVRRFRYFSYYTRKCDNFHRSRVLQIDAQFRSWM